MLLPTRILRRQQLVGVDRLHLDGGHVFEVLPFVGDIEAIGIDDEECDFLMRGTVYFSSQSETFISCGGIQVLLKNLPLELGRDLYVGVMTHHKRRKLT